MKFNSKGFTHLEIFLVIVVVGFVGFVGYYVYQNRPKDNVPGTSQTSVGQGQNADAIKSVSDLNTTNEELDKLDTESDLNEISQLETEIQNL